MFYCYNCQHRVMLSVDIAKDFILLIARLAAEVFVFGRQGRFLFWIAQKNSWPSRSCFFVIAFFLEMLLIFLLMY